MHQDQLKTLKETANKVAHRVTGSKWEAHNDSGDRQGVFDTQDYLVLGVNRVTDHHYENEEQYGDPELHEYIATFDPSTVLDLIRDNERLEADKIDLEEHSAELEDEVNQWESWEVVPHEELALLHVNRRAQIRLRSTDRIVGTLTHVSSGRSGGVFELDKTVRVTVTIKVAGSDVTVYLGNGDVVAVGPTIETA